MVGDRRRKPSSGKKKRYYKPPTALDRIRHRLTDGTPTHELLHYLHGRNKLPADVRAIAEAAEKLHQVRELLDEVKADGRIREVAKTVRVKFPELVVLVGGKADKMIRNFIVEARKALVIKTMKKPEE